MKRLYGAAKTSHRRKQNRTYEKQNRSARNARAYERAREQKRLLHERLGNKCSQCGEDGNQPLYASSSQTEKASQRRRDGRQTKPRELNWLEVDHQDGRDWKLAEAGFVHRVRVYLREERDGVRLRLLCRRCNAKFNPRLEAAKRAVETETVDNLENDSLEPTVDEIQADDSNDTPF